MKQLNEAGEHLPGKRKSSEAASPRFKRARTGARDFSRASAHLGLEARRKLGAASASGSGAASGARVGRASADVRLAKSAAREG